MLHVEHLHYRYGSHKVLADVSIDLEARQLAMLIGTNGAGKSTLLRCIAGWSSPDQGSILINGISIHESDQEFRRQVVFVPDTPDFYDELTAWEHLQFIAQLRRLKQWETEAKTLLTAFQLIDQRGTFPFTFSRGMQYKLALCLALLAEPRLLLLDEPFGPLDAHAKRVLWRRLEAYVQAGNTVLFSSHFVPANKPPDTVLRLRHGQIERVSSGERANDSALFGKDDD